MTTQNGENKQNRHRIHTPLASVQGGIPKRAPGKEAPIALEDKKTYWSRAVGAISIEGETGNIGGAVIMARTRDSKFARKSCPELLASGLLGKLVGDPWARRRRLA
jgi:hypothetical protein